MPWADFIYMDTVLNSENVEEKEEIQSNTLSLFSRC